MSAVNQLSTEEKRSYEPSMEEILASIRRIISDDQTIPGRASTSTADLAASLSAAPAPVAASPSTPRAIPLPPEAELQSQHGSVFTPQFPSPPEAATASADVGLSSLSIRGPAPETRPDSAPADDAVPRLDELDAEPATSPTASDASDGEAESSLGLVSDAHPYPGIPDAAEGEREPEDPSVSAAADGLVEPPTSPEPPKAEATVEAAPVPVPPPTLFSEATDSSVASAFNMLAASRLADNSDELMNLAREMIRPLLRAWLDDNLPSMVERMVRAEIERVARGGR